MPRKSLSQNALFAYLQTPTDNLLPRITLIDSKYCPDIHNYITTLKIAGHSTIWFEVPKLPPISKRRTLRWLLEPLFHALDLTYEPRQAHEHRARISYENRQIILTVFNDMDHLLNSSNQTDLAALTWIYLVYHSAVPPSHHFIGIGDSAKLQSLAQLYPPLNDHVTWPDQLP